MAQLRLLIVDDSAMYRQALQDIVATIPGVTCIGVACDGKEAMKKIISEKPDAVTLDMEMPVMTGMEVIKAVIAQNLETKLIIVSACSQTGAEVAINALKLGAYDFITKPNRLGGAGAKEHIHQQLVETLGLPNIGFTGAKAHSSITSSGANHRVYSKRQKLSPTVKSRSMQIAPTGELLHPQAVVMGCSTGGPKALLKLFAGLQDPVDVPIFIVQHMPPMFTQTLAKSINEISVVSVKEAENGDKPLPNHAYIAPGGRQMKLVKGSEGVEIRVTDDETNNFCKPSVDYFFDSVSDIYQAGVLGVILSGMGDDGCEGLRRMKRYGAKILGQNEESCVVYGMPRVAQEAGLVDQQVGIEQMAAAIEGVLKGPTKGSKVNIKAS